MKVYPEYKDSGVDGLGNVPSHWGVYNLKRLTQFIYGDSLSKENRTDGKIPVYGSNGIVGYHDEATTKFPCLIIGRKGSFGKINYSDVECFPIDTTYFIDERATNNNIRWLYYLLLSLRLDAYSKDSAVPGLSREDAYERRTVLPPLSEQQAIADFLDRKTAQIDTLIAKKQRQIELLQEQRTALINHAVTKGLNPDVQMKDSDVEWLGEIPIHWHTLQIRRIVEDHKQGFYTTESYVDKGTKLLRITDIDESASIDFANCPMVDISNENKESFGLEVGDFVFVRTGATVGKFGIIRQKVDAVFASYLIRFRFSNKIFSEYLKYYFFSNFFWHGLVSDVHGGANHNIHAENIKNQYIALPPIHEQEEIVSRLDKALLPILKQINTIKKEMELILEYRTALISEAVTGKIDVRNA